MLFLKFKSSREGTPAYGMLEGDRLLPLRAIASVPELFAAVGKKKIKSGKAIAMAGVRPLPPTDERVGVYCAGLNYSDHAREVKMPIPQSPIFFTKGHGSLAGALDDVIYPEETRLLDYEVELALVIGRMIGKGDRVTEGNLADYVLGITILNDVSARDIQLKSGQWFLGKSFRTFAPMGPCVQVLNSDAMERLYDLSLSLQVFDSGGNPYEGKRQKGNTVNMIFRAHELINALTARFDLLPGDVIATGTPCGVALSRPGYLKSRVAEILGVPQGKRTAAFIDGEIHSNKSYLQQGDLVTASISSADGVIDLGEQRNRIVE